MDFQHLCYISKGAGEVDYCDDDDGAGEVDYCNDDSS